MKDLINRKDDLVANCATQPYYLKVRNQQGQWGCLCVPVLHHTLQIFGSLPRQHMGQSACG